MALFRKRKEIGAFDTVENEFRQKTKTDLILELENERLEISQQIEKLARQYSRESGIKKLARRRFKIGKAPNDWKDEYVSYK